MTVFYVGLCLIGFTIFGFFVWALCKAAARADEHIESGGKTEITDEEVERRR